MSEKSQRVLVSYIDELPEIDDSGSVENIENNLKNGIEASSAVELLEEFGKPSFKYSWFVLKKDILNSSFEKQVNFIEEMMQKMEEVYDYTFPEKIPLYSDSDLQQFYKYIEFLEYDHLDFLKTIWKYLGIENLLKIDIRNYCQTHEMKIIKEIEHNADTYFESRLISILLRTYYKNGMINWFIKNSIRLKVEITVLINQEKGE